ncbi:transcription repressor NadR [uncultured Eubacterium sp.]|uniref:transcription repressor NadR n=1 Tax=uncultured Eubacterium sp. TaxID=165185 RepID=UPI0025D7A5B6|nr:transcription repressor NadR [uncultured Eubacterium sp.]
MTDGATRRTELMKILKQESRPLSGAELSRQFGVSRQVIVQDIALLRATNRNILSTNKGYVLFDPDRGQKLCHRSFAVQHTDEQIREELYVIVDRGGRVCDVVVEHEIYGQLSADLILKNRMDVDEFIRKMGETSNQPLKILTGDSHFHTVEAESEEILDEIEAELHKKGFLRE